MISEPTELRFFDTKNMDQERAMVYGYFQEAIRAYGKDVVYYKMSDKITNDGKENSELGYGFDPHRKLVKKVDLRSYIKFDAYNFQFNQWGFEPKAELVFFFSLNDFAVNFIDDFGKFRKFDIKKASGKIEYNGESYIRLPFTCDITSGLVEFGIYPGYKGEYIDGRIVAMYEPVYKIQENPYTHRTYTSDYHGNYFVPSIRARFRYGAVSGVEYDMDGSVMYSGYQEARVMSDVIRPNIGDIIEVPYDTEDNHVEQYEISQVLDRLPTAGNSISYLMGRYVWQCHAVRRVASQSDEVQITEEATKKEDSISTYISKREEMNRKNNQDWKQETCDEEIYGGYNTDEKYDLTGDRSDLTDCDKEEDNKITSKEVLDPEKKEGWKVIAQFKDGLCLTTDGNMLFYESGDRRALIKGFSCDWEVVFGREHEERAYLFNCRGNLCFINKDGKKIRITSFDEEMESVNSNPDGAYYADDVATLEDNWYIFKESKMAIYSKNGELICVSGNGEEEVLATVLD